MKTPGFWMNETSGVLRPAVTAYLENRPMDARQIAAMRAYLRQWMEADWAGPTIDVLRTMVEEINTTKDLHRWFAKADEIGIDPL